MCFQASLGIVLLFLSIYDQVYGRGNLGNYATEEKGVKKTPMEHLSLCNLYPSFTGLLRSASDYFLFRRSTNATTAFTTNNRCVELSYIFLNDTSDIVTLDVRESEEHEWEPKLLTATINSTEKNIIRYSTFDIEDTEDCEFWVMKEDTTSADWKHIMPKARFCKPAFDSLCYKSTQVYYHRLCRKQ
ncbi:uncharacterized protein LOC142571127 isoform X2 [Dermacentor variabilis]|uniref:uncharacterized protein LOC142571127 isoform X2 n=1 Tax=Dermacentor variabilis TaxID=34621 RepID=UPI003F5BDD64